MVSFDVESLFTNIPLDESIQLAIDYIISNTNTKLTTKELGDLFYIATSQSHFSFKGCYYDQTDGVAMGSPLVPVLANLFLGHHEKKWLNEFSSAEVLFYRRCVDDTFCVFDSPTPMRSCSFNISIPVIRTYSSLWRKNANTLYLFLMS